MKLFRGKVMLQKNYMIQSEKYREETHERRQHTRFKAKTDAVVLISTPSGKLYGFLLDISAGGISFEYIPVSENEITTKEMHVILDGSNLRFDRLPSKSISDFEIEDTFYTPVKMRRRGVQFIGLTREQLSNLEWFIQDSALEIAQSN